MKIKITKLPSSNKYAYGGQKNPLGGADFTNGVTFINEGGTHEQNPLQGVPMGVDKESTPNLVEEGEIIWNDYVFSNRLTPNKKLLNQYGFLDKYADYTFAKIAEELQKESAERPNDIISKKGLQDNMQTLIAMQEAVREKRKQREANQFKEGGDVNILHGKDTNPSTTTGESPKTTFTPNFLRDVLGIYPKIPSTFTTPDFTTTIPGGSTVNIMTGESTPAYIAEFEKDPNNHFNKTMQDLKSNLVKTKMDSVESPEDPKFDWTKFGNNLLRTAPIWANAANLISNLKKPDYSEGNRILEAANAAPISNIQPEVQDISIRPIDTNYLANQIRNQGNTVLSNIGNQAISGQQAMANMMLANAQTQGQYADMMFKSNDANLERELQEAQFNRANDQFRTQTAFQNYSNNFNRHKGIMDAVGQSVNYNTLIDQARTQGILGSIGNLATDIAGIGSENNWKNIIDKHPSLSHDSSGVYKQQPTTTPTTTPRKYGDRLLTKKRRK